jgi:heme o synthase
VANQVLEQDHDRQMTRTQSRPLAAARMNRRAAAWFSGTLCVVGCAWLGIAVNLGAMFLAGLAFLIYAFLYTPLKRQTPACILVGAVAGALPFAVGSAAAGADFDLWASLGFVILFVWQIPHVLAIVWWRRSEYAQAGFRMLSQSDIHGKATAGWAMGAALTVVGLSLVPGWLKSVSLWYIPGSLALGTAFIWFTLQFVLRRSESTARRLFIASLYYLPVLYLLMLLCQGAN